MKHGATDTPCGREDPAVTARRAIEHSLVCGTPTYLRRQAIERGHAQGYLKANEREELTTRLDERGEP